MGYIVLNDGGFVRAERVLTIGRADSAAMRRLLASLPRGKIVNLTGGRRRQAVIVLDTGHAVVCAVSPDELHGQLAALGPGAGREG